MKRALGAIDAPAVTFGPRGASTVAHRVGAEVRKHLMQLWVTLKLVWRSAPLQTLAYAAATLAAGSIPLGVAAVAKRIVDAITAGSHEATGRWVIAECVLVAAAAGAQRGIVLLRSLLGTRLALDINASVLRKAIDLDLSFFEDPAFHDALMRTQGDVATRPIGLLSESFALFQVTITLVGYGVMLAAFSGWSVVLLCAAALPAALAELRYARLAFTTRNWQTPGFRQMLYWKHVLSDDKHAKELKLFDLGLPLLDRHERLGERLYDEERRVHVKRATWTQALSLLATGAFYATYGVMALMGASGRLTLGQVTLYVLALRQGQQAFQSGLASAGSIYEHNLYMSNLWRYLGIPGGVLGAAPDRAVPTAALSASRGLVLEGVGFRYAAGPRWALRNVNMTIPPGESVALVGDNGAGKTTLVKLITRLYEPTEGRIVLDGRDLRDWEPRALRRRFGVVFQDFNRYQLNVRENVAIGDISHIDDGPRIDRALQNAGADAVVAALPAGLDAQLGQLFENGVELSGGQWQKIALARAFMREESDILILDEPTAALDAEAEHDVFERFRALAKNRTTIVISHRFPAVRMARQIVVLDAGCVHERGTHDELVAMGGKYARMFALQAEGYR